MNASTHLGISAVAAVAVYKLTGSQSMSISLLLSGVLIDLDHVSDYVLLSKEQFSMRRFFSWYNDHRWRKLYIFFHSYELMALLVIISLWLDNSTISGVTTGGLLHLMCDQIGNIKKKNQRLSSWFYFLTYRYAVDFEKKNYMR